MPRRAFYGDEENPYDYTPKFSTTTEYKDEEKPNIDTFSEPVKDDEIVPSNIITQQGWGTISRNLSSPENRATRTPALYDSVVSETGGDYTTLQDAIKYINDIGGGSILLKSGTYNLSGITTISGNTTIVGEDINTTTIACGDFNLYINGSDRSAAGTISLTTGSTAVTGVGSTFTDFSAGDYLIVNGKAYKIASITDNTNLVLTYKYQGESQSGIAYDCYNLIENVQLSTFQMTGTTSQIDANFVKNCLFDNLYSNNSGGIPYELDSVFDSVFNNLLIRDSVNIGMQFGSSSTECFNNKVTNCNIEFGDSTGISIYGSNNSIINNNILSNDNNGIGIIGTKNIIKSNVIYHNDGSGVSCTGDKNIIVGNDCSYNDADGIGIGDASDQADHNTVSNNVCIGNGGNGIEFSNNASRNIASSNQCISNAGYGLIVSQGSASSCVATSNVLYTNTTGQLGDSGTTTVTDNNVTT